MRINVKLFAIVRERAGASELILELPEKARVSTASEKIAEQLQQLYLAGFELETFDRFPKAIGVVRDGCLAFLVPGPDGLQILGNVGLRMGESLGPLVERGGKQVFVHKQEVLEATPEKIAILEKFKQDLNNVLHQQSTTLG